MTRIKTVRKHPDAKCEICPLNRTGKLVHNYGNWNSNIAFVSKAPSMYDAKKGFAFSGESGTILKQILKGLGFNPKDMFYTNLVLCAGKKGSPSEAAIRACKPRLDKELLGRTTIVPLGAIQKRFGLPYDSVLDARLGSPKRRNGIRYIPTYQPAALLRNANWFPDLVADLKKIKQDHIEWVPPKYKVIKNYVTATKFLNSIPKGIKLAIDIETEKDKDVDTYNPTKKRLLCIGMAPNSQRVVTLGKEIFQIKSPEVAIALKKVLENSKIIAHNGKFDLNGVTEFIGQDHKATLWFDTMLASYATDERSGTNALEGLGREILGAPNWKKDVKKKNLATIPDQELYEYNAYDVGNTFALYEHYEKVLKKQGLTKLFKFIMRSSDTLMKIERNGVAVDMAYLRRLKRIYTKKQGLLLKQLRNLTEDPDFNPNSHIQVRKYFKKKGYEIPNTQAETIEKYLNHHVMGIYAKRHIEFKKGAKTLSTYINGTLNREVNGRVYTTYKLHGTVTGRLSSANPNLQNITRGSELRNIYAASPGHILIKADYSQAELRAMAWMAKDEFLREVFSEGRDIHGEVAANIFGPEWTKAHRQVSKMVVYGLSYGMGARYLGHNLNVSIDIAQEYIDEFFGMIPMTEKWIDNIKNEILTNHKLVSPFGYVRRFPFINRVNRRKILKEGMSFLPQNIVSNMTMETANRMTELGYGNDIRLLVHDELVFEVPQTEYKLYARSIKTFMEEIGTKIFEGYIPAVADLAVGQTWGNLKEIEIERQDNNIIL